MPLKVPNAGELVLLDKLLGSGIGSLTMKLFKNDKTPADADVAADYTEATFTGYMQQTITGPWGSAASDGSGRAAATASQLTFTSSADQTAQDIFGYYVLSGATLVWAERFGGGAVSISHNGDKIKVTPRLTFKTEF